jgi:glycosyltransferase involved in cell wall biosynthesis
MDRKSKLTIITVTYNCRDDLEKTMASIREQTVQNFEYLVIDGGSTDGTLDVIEKGREWISSYISKKDRGVYDAMNKGIRRAGGRMIYFLNAGDTFYSRDAVEQILNADQNSQWDVLYGHAALASGGHQWIKKQPAHLTKSYLLLNNVCHQSMVYKKRLFSEYGDYDREEKIFADYKHLLSLFFSNKVRFKHTDYVLCSYDTNGQSSKKSFLYTFKHRYRILRPFLTWPEQLGYPLYWLLHKPLSVYQSKKKWTEAVQ